MDTKDQTAEALAKAAQATTDALAMAKRAHDSEINAAVVANDISYIKKDLSEIKQGIKDMSGVYISRRELKEHLDPITEKVEGLIANQRLVITTIVIAVLGGIMSLILIK